MLPNLSETWRRSLHGASNGARTMARAKKKQNKSNGANLGFEATRDTINTGPVPDESLEHYSIFSTLVTGTSSSYQRVKPDYLLAMAVVVPPREAIQVYTESANSLHQRIGINLKESQTLTALRATLLPKLLPGELRLREGEKLAETHT
jgi:hypothetical protein